MSLVAAGAAAALFLVAVLTSPRPGVAALGAVGLALAGAGILARWLRLVSVAAATLVAAYAAALSISRPAASIATGAMFGLGVLVLLQAAEFGRCTRHGHVGTGVVRQQVAGWLRLAAGTLGLVAVGATAAGTMARSVPPAAAPVLAAAGALGVVFATALVIAGDRRRSGRGSAPRPREP